MKVAAFEAGPATARRVGRRGRRLPLVDVSRGPTGSCSRTRAGVSSLETTFEFRPPPKLKKLLSRHPVEVVADAAASASSTWSIDRDESPDDRPPRWFEVQLAPGRVDRRRAVLELEVAAGGVDGTAGRRRPAGSCAEREPGSSGVDDVGAVLEEQVVLEDAAVDLAAAWMPPW